ncbi:hypothetical protein HK407_12g17080 [Ordospora pajunii]|jgi:hypothetical protein|uniref:uncharacterized protein n=1 Tax=Ordospora pajunii TaxID=3039483 RepID=UPI0029526E8C|nr:uncharacterized protein HK407_12g17080 [Ordospora pajunii]KAH9410577.1 hypothetical protein HK407_12g17080 [Ordospora pajunii]
MDIRQSFINSRKTPTAQSETPDESLEEEYYKWKIRCLKRRLRDIRKEMQRIANIHALQLGNDAQLNKQ